MDDGTPELKRCEVCGDPLRPDNKTGICYDDSKPECLKERRRRETRKPQMRPKTAPTLFCRICGRVLRKNNKSGLCDGKNSPACKSERNRLTHANRVYVPAFAPGEEQRFCDICGAKLNRNNTIGVCGNEWKPACRRERKRRIREGATLGHAGPAIRAGDTFGKWTALEDARIETMHIQCRCECGNEKPVFGRNLILGLSPDCGCEYMQAAARRRFPDPYIAAGTVFGRLTVLEDVWRQADGKVRCRCSCKRGTEVMVTPHLLKSGSTQSCGCLRRELRTTHGLSRHPLYKTWRSMTQRCTNPNADSYPNYGGRGIKVCERWMDVALFIEDIEREIGPRPEGRYDSGAPLYTLDRIRVNGNYESGNVKWSDQSEQVRNQRKVSALTAENTALAGQVEALKAQIRTLREQCA